MSTIFKLSTSLCKTRTCARASIHRDRDKNTFLKKGTKIFFFFFFFYCTVLIKCASPWCNRHGWLGVKKQRPSFLPSFLLSSSTYFFFLFLLVLLLLLLFFFSFFFLSSSSSNNWPISSIWMKADPFTLSLWRTLTGPFKVKGRNLRGFRRSSRPRRIPRLVRGRSGSARPAGIAARPWPCRARRRPTCSRPCSYWTCMSTQSQLKSSQIAVSSPHGEIRLSTYGPLI